MIQYLQNENRPKKNKKKLTIAIALISLFHLLWILSNRFPQNVNFDRRKEAPAWLASQDRLDAIILSGNYLYAVAPPSRHFSGRESEESGKMGLMHSRKKGDDNRYLQRGIESSYFFYFFLLNVSQALRRSFSKILYVLLCCQTVFFSITLLTRLQSLFFFIIYNVCYIICLFPSFLIFVFFSHSQNSISLP